MKKLVAIVAFVAFFAMVSASFAASLAGTVSKVDAKAGTLSVKGADGKEMTFTADAKVLGGLKADGSKVTVTYETKDGKNTASKVEAAK